MQRLKSMYVVPVIEMPAVPIHPFQRVQSADCAEQEEPGRKITKVVGSQATGQTYPDVGR
jgi:hypothetical protein